LSYPHEGNLAMPAHILIVDDDPLLARLLTFVLSDNGYRATAVADPGAVVPLLAGEQIDLVLLDIMLPGIDGLTLLTAIRGADPALPVIFLSARGTIADQVTGLDRGADDYVAKPFEPIELLARIRAVLGRTGRGGGR
jgi:DNA-binding response OmpR family regulator